MPAREVWDVEPAIERGVELAKAAGASCASRARTARSRTSAHTNDPYLPEG